MSARVPAALAAVLDGRTPAGVLPWPADRPVADALAAARDAGWTGAALGLEGVADKAGFMDACTAALDLPGYFGRNWDALADCLTDLSWLPPARGRLLVVTGWQGYAAAVPEEWAVVEEVLADAVAYWRDSATALALIMAGGRGRQGV
ncbi:barstar family protein [Streptomyces sp. RS10V-4]|uniref:barstar family protein n=1 Tax=Streptomyces rhizoryzae TaxID=2932493 RepID=UPI002003A844|nr:barstar family protein [Streptomyces rhizoryzae]MCK7625979.1 barstar family protein [Streptomyces rhizoryzae]